jgi:hypothetical protein
VDRGAEVYWEFLTPATLVNRFRMLCTPAAARGVASMRSRFVSEA